MKPRRLIHFFLPFFIVAVFFLRGVATPPASEPQKVLTESYTVTRVVDGDTLVVNIGGTETKVRLIGLNTPETVDPRRSVECFGKEASDKAKETLTGKTVTVETDVSQSRYDKYGRLLAYIFLPDGTNFSEMMIREGYGYEYTYDVAYKYQAAFKAAQKDAQKNKRGLWASGVCGN